jgi:hypothetical protein
MPQSFRPLNIEEECILLVWGEELTTPQATRASNFHVPRVHVHEKKHNFPLINLWSVNSKCVKWH